MFTFLVYYVAKIFNASSYPVICARFSGRRYLNLTIRFVSRMPEFYGRYPFCFGLNSSVVIVKKQ